MEDDVGWGEVASGSDCGQQPDAASPDGWGEVACDSTAPSVRPEVSREASVSCDGWGEVAAESTASSSAKPKVSETAPRRGRPPGSFGSRLLREALPPRPAIAVRTNAEAPAQLQDGQRRQPVQADASNALAPHGALVQALDAHVQGTALGQALWMACRQAAAAIAATATAKRSECHDSSLIFRPLLQPRRCISSLEAESQRLGCGRVTLSRDLKHCAASLLSLSQHAWGGFLRAVKSLTAQTSWSALAVFKRRRYDETPTKIQTQREDIKGQDASTAKIFQTEYTAAVLLVEPVLKKTMLVQTTCPTAVTCCEDSTERCVRGCQRYVESLLPDMHDIFEPARVHSFTLPCSDRHASNLAAEATISAQDADWLSCHTLCDVHKASQIQTVMFAFVRSQVSGLISCALSMYAAGATHRMRQALAEVLEDTLIVEEGEPLDEWRTYSDSVLDLFLDSSCNEHGRVPVQRYRCQKHVVQTFLNGDLQHSVPRHWSTRPIDRDELLEQVKTHLVPNLIPCACPMFQRAKWTGAECTISWAGILSLHHSLLRQVMQRLHGSAPAAAPVQDTPAPGWGGVAQDAEAGSGSADPGALPAASRQDFADADAASAPAAAEEDWLQKLDFMVGNIDWAEIHRCMKQKAVSWASHADTGTLLVLMRHCMKAPLVLMHHLLKISGQKWQRQQHFLDAVGQERSYRILDGFEGDSLERFWETLRQAMTKSS